MGVFGKINSSFSHMNESLFSWYTELLIRIVLQNCLVFICIGKETDLFYLRDRRDGGQETLCLPSLCLWGALTVCCFSPSCSGLFPLHPARWGRQERCLALWEDVLCPFPVSLSHRWARAFVSPQLSLCSPLAGAVAVGAHVVTAGVWVLPLPASA